MFAGEKCNSATIMHNKGQVKGFKLYCMHFVVHNMQ